MTANVQISGKANNGVIFVVGGNDTDDFLVNLAAVVGDRQTAEDILSHAASLITPTSVGGPGSASTTLDQAQQNVQQSFPQSQPVQQQAPHNQHNQYNPQAPQCQHGDRTYREGTSKAGKGYKAWFCSSPDRNDQCEAQWIR